MANLENSGYRQTVKTRAFSKLSVPAYTTIKYRKVADGPERTQQLKQELLEREALAASTEDEGPHTLGSSPDTKGCKLLDAPSDAAEPPCSSESGVVIHPLDRDVTDDEDSSSDEEDDDELVELQRELDRIKKERAEEKARQERELLEEQAREREAKIMSGNSLLDETSFQLKKKWYEETVFKNQAQDDPKYKKRFINDTVRNDFHKRFLKKYIR